MTDWPHWTLTPDGEEQTQYRDVVIALRRLPDGRVRIETRSAREDRMRPCIAPFAHDFAGADQARTFVRDLVRAHAERLRDER